MQQQQQRGQGGGAHREQQQLAAAKAALRSTEAKLAALQARLRQLKALEAAKKASEDNASRLAVSIQSMKAKPEPYPLCHMAIFPPHSTITPRRHTDLCVYIVDPRCSPFSSLGCAYAALRLRLGCA